LTYVAKASLKGYDVDTCADYQLAFNSEFPMLKIAAQGSFTISDTTQDVTIWNNTLGYIPVFWVFLNNYYNTGDSVFGVGKALACGMNLNGLTYYGNTLQQGSGSISGYYYVFYYNMLSSYTSPIIKTSPGILNVVDHWGIYVTKPGKDVSSTDYRDFSINTDCKNDLVHLSGNSTNLQNFINVVTVPHNLGYSPQVMMYSNYYAVSQTVIYPNAWFLSSGAGVTLIPSDITTSGYSTDATNVYFSVTGVGSSIAYLIMKDPFVI
jgi:hypothetical protein